MPSSVLTSSPSGITTPTHRNLLMRFIMAMSPITYLIFVIRMSWSTWSRNLGRSMSSTWVDPCRPKPRSDVIASYHKLRPISGTPAHRNPWESPPKRLTVGASQIVRTGRGLTGVKANRDTLGRNQTPHQDGAFLQRVLQPHRCTGPGAAFGSMAPCLRSGVFQAHRNAVSNPSM